MTLPVHRRPVLTEYGVVAALLVAPLVVLAYLKLVPESDFLLRLVALHQFVSAAIVGLTGALGMLALRAFVMSCRSWDLGLGVALLAFAAVHLPRVGMVAQDPYLFVLWGPASRIAMSAGLWMLSGNERKVAASDCWGHAAIAAGVILLVGALSWAAFAPVQSLQMDPETINRVRLGMEIVALAAVAAAAVRCIFWNASEIHLLVALALAAEQSMLFLASEPWHLLWWTAHIVGLSGTLSLAWAVLLEAERGRLLAAEQAARVTAEMALRTRNQFLSMAAHELRTPVAAIQAYAQLLQREAARIRPAREGLLSEAIPAIVDHAHKVDRLVGQLLDIERLQRGGPLMVPVLTDAMEVVRSAAQATHLLTERTVDLQGPASLEVWVDPMWLEQALANLLDNAAKYSPPDSTIEVKVEEEPPALIAISVRDRGGGIPLPGRNQLFEPFFRAEPERTEGRGLGLYICRLVAESHNGSITVEFPEDGGSRFVLRLPKGEAPAVG